MFERITAVQPGMVILEAGGGRTEVKDVEISPEGCKNKVHINKKDCYEIAAEVRVGLGKH